MAEVKVNDLPVISITDFTDNDRFVIVDDGKARQLTRATFKTWLLDNVQGEKGEQGFTGRDGTNGTNGNNGINGTDGLDAYQIAVGLGYVGTRTQWVASLKGLKGDTGVNGENGWSPVMVTEDRGSEVVLKLSDWVGGTGTKPTTLGYISSTGIVTNIANASDIKGTKGDKGDIGLTGEKGADGAGARIVSSIVFNSDLSATVTYNDSTTVTSGTPPKKTGWSSYKDNEYTSAAPFTVLKNTQTVLPNNATTKTENTPTGVSTFYNAVTQKYLLTDPKGFYNVRVRFKAAGSPTASFVNISMSKDTTDVPYSEDRALRGDSQIQELTFNAQLYGDEALASNGLTIRIKPHERDIVVYSIEVTVAKLI